MQRLIGAVGCVALAADIFLFRSLSLWLTRSFGLLLTRQQRARNNNNNRAASIELAASKASSVRLEMEHQTKARARLRMGAPVGPVGVHNLAAIQRVPSIHGLPVANLTGQIRPKDGVPRHSIRHGQAIASTKSTNGANLESVAERTRKLHRSPQRHTG